MAAFVKDDAFHVAVDYSHFIDEVGRNPNEQEYGQYFADYIRKIHNLHKKQGEKLVVRAAIVHVGKQNGKVHHHLLIKSCPKIRIDDIMRLWEHGYIRTKSANTKALREHIFG